MPKLSWTHSFTEAGAALVSTVRRAGAVGFAGRRGTCTGRGRRASLSASLECGIGKHCKKCERENCAVEKTSWIHQSNLRYRYEECIVNLVYATESISETVAP
jgi:hypothetical protein